jgi:hypothetical protein
MNSSDSTRPGRERALSVPLDIPQRARDGGPALMKITDAVTSDGPDGQPWPPTESDALWRLLRRAEGYSHWRAIELAESDPLPRTCNS